MIPPKCYFTESVINKWAYISEMPPNQSDYLCFWKCTLNLCLEKPMLINYANISYLPFSSHCSNSVSIKSELLICLLILCRSINFFWIAFTVPMLGLLNLCSVVVQQCQKKYFIHQILFTVASCVYCFKCSKVNQIFRV